MLINVIYHINIMKEKNDMIISINEEKVSDNIQHPFMKTFNKLRTQGNHISIIKVIYEKPPTNITLNDERLKVFPLRSEQGKDVAFATSIQHSTGNQSQKIRQEKEKHLDSK